MSPSKRIKLEDDFNKVSSTNDKIETTNNFIDNFESSIVYSKKPYKIQKKKSSYGKIQS